MRTFRPPGLAFLLGGFVALTPARAALADQSEVSKPAPPLPEVITLQNIRTMLVEIKTALSAYASEEQFTNFVIRIIDTTNCLYLHIVDRGIATSLTIGNLTKTVTLSHARPLPAAADQNNRLEALNALNHRFPLVKFTLRGKQLLSCENTFSISEGIPLRQIVANYEQFWSNISEFSRTHARPDFEPLQEPGANGAPAPGGPKQF